VVETIRVSNLNDREEQLPYFNEEQLIEDERA